MLGSSTNKLPFVALLLIGVGVVYLLQKGPAPPPSKPKPRAVLVSVEVIDVFKQPQALFLSSQGVVSPTTQIALLAEVSGVIREVSDSFEVGAVISSEEMLLQIDDTDYRTALAQSEANQAAAEQALATEQAQARQARREWRDLGSDEANAVFLRQPHIKSAKANIKSASLAVQSAKLDLERTRVRIPFTGRVREKLVDVGQYVTLGTQLATVYASDSVEVRLPLSLSQRAQLGNALTFDESFIPVEFIAEYGDGQHVWQGKIVREEGVLDSQSRQVYLIAEITEPFISTTDSQKLPLQLGQYLRATIALPEKKAAFRLPRSALRQKNQIWIVEAQDTLRKLSVDVLQYGKDEVIVAIPEYEKLRVIVSGLSYAVDGMPVAVSATVDKANAPANKK